MMFVNTALIFSFIGGILSFIVNDKRQNGYILIKNGLKTL